MEADNKLLVMLIILFGIYVEVLLMIFADLWSGVRKAKRRGELRTSTGYKRTIDKIARYFNALIALTIIDAMQASAIWYLDTYYGYAIPVIPIVSVIGAIGISLVEIKSIFENGSDDEKHQAEEAAKLGIEIAKNIKNPEEIGNAVLKYLKLTEEENHESK
jgi:phage-related holin